MKSKDIEKMIHLYLDDELAPEQRIELERIVQNDTEVRKLFNHLQQTHSVITNALGVLAEHSEDSFDVVYSQARNSLIEKRRSALRSFSMHFVSGLAAGLMIALGLLWFHLKSSSVIEPIQPIAKEDQRKNIAPVRFPEISSFQDEVKPVIHEVDLYYYVDPDGKEWMMEGLHHNMVRQTSSGSI